jgi:hypothetical protein
MAMALGKKCEMSSETLKEYFTSENTESWKQLNSLYESRFKAGIQWVFRGQKEDAWGLKSSLERELENVEIDLCYASDLERGLLRKFKRQCHHYISNIPDANDTLEWLALMQHYGAPTRLLDWTYSFFVALYFAVESATKSEQSGQKIRCAVWGLNSDWMGNPFGFALKQYPDALQVWEEDKPVLRPETFKASFVRQPPIALVGAVNPRRLNKRLTIQQGVFLCPGEVCKSFEENLIALLSNCKSESKANFIKITIEVTLEAKKEILLNLQRMNINRATLFPGLEGFAQSLKTLMIFPSIFLHPGDEEM